MKNKKQIFNLYKVTTSYEGDRNFNSYYVVASNGVSAGAIINLQINSRVKKTVRKDGTINYSKEQVDEIERVAGEIIIPDTLI